MKRFTHTLCKTMTLAAMACLTLGSAMAQSNSMDIAEFGSFHIGGRLVQIQGQPVREVVFTPGGAPAKIDPNGNYLVESMYVQYFTPAKIRAKVPILLWHGGGLTGVTYETTPDGREGWSHFFIRHGWKTYVSDAVERGRSGWASPDVWPGTPQFLPIENPWPRFRMGAKPWSEDPKRREEFAGNQFPAEGYLNFMRQVVPRWTTTDQATIMAYTELVDKVCPCVVLVHSQGGQFGQKVAQARPNLVKALVLVEPAGFGDPEQAAALKNTPILTIYGDHIQQDARWPKMRDTQLKLNELYRQAGAQVDVIDLPEVGIKGNSHMMMMDRNNQQIAQLIQDWLQRKGLAD
jgi:pimeloyl-ACP methyl ester carboxylesterase